MILIYVKKNTHRINYVFKHIFLRILCVEIDFTTSIEDFISYDGPKLSYGKNPLGNELFFQSQGLLDQQGIESVEINVKKWDDTKCFFSVGDKSALPFDIFAASFYLLSRYEEYLPHMKDDNNRYPASECLAVKEHFINKPVVDIWAYKLKDILDIHFPTLTIVDRSMTIHNLVVAQEPFAYKYKGLFRVLAGYIEDLSQLKFRRLLDRTSVILSLNPDPYQTFNWIIEKIKESTSKLTVFFLLGESVRFRDGINSQRKYFTRGIKIVADYTEVGLIFSNEAQSRFSLMKKEKKQMENIINRSLRSSINDQFLVELPENYRDLVELEVERDYTMIYHDTVGFRSGTCTPSLFYDLDYEVLTPLVTHTVAISTTALYDRSPSEIRSIVEEHYNSVKEVNGTFSMLFSNKDFSTEPDNEIWKEIFHDKLQQYAS